MTPLALPNIDMDAVSLLAIVGLFIVFYWTIWILWCLTFHPLADVPGPIWPAVSRTWLMYHVYLGDLHIAQGQLHAEYGPLVRIAPNEVLSKDPAAIPTIYRGRNPLSKSDYYPTFRLTGVGKQADLFTDTDEVHHAQYRKIVMPAYQMSSVLKNEDAIDECTELFIGRMRKFAPQQKSMDLGQWLEMYAYDVIGRLLFGKQFGFLEREVDVGNYIESVDKALPLLVFAAVAPSYARPLIMLMGLAIPGSLKALKAVKSIRNEAKRIAKERLDEPEEQSSKKSDIFSQLTKIVREKGPGIEFGLDEMVLESWVGIVAGADSVAISLRSIFYHLMQHPKSFQKCAAEVSAAGARGLLSRPVKYKETISHLPYTCACITEASRLFPSFQIHMGRIAPREGLELSGYYIPAGYRVGMNAGVVQLDRALFGQDSCDFRPERWLESPERNLVMGKGMLRFGAGTRTCSGKHIATVELHKLVPEVLRDFQIKMAHNRGWKLRNAGFVKQKDLIVKVTWK